jgi:hypothetical protein
MSSKLQSTLIEIISALLILLFVYTGISKLNEHSTFRAVLSNSPIIKSNANLLSWGLPVAELFTAFLLFVHPTRKWGVLISLVLMIIFTCYISYVILFAANLPCSCGGVLKQLTWSQHLLFNIMFTGLAGLGTWLSYNNKAFIAINRTSRTPV